MKNRPETLHKYVYTGADPVNLIDPSGLATTVEGVLNNRHTVRLTREQAIAIGLSVLCSAIHTASTLSPDAFDNIPPPVSNSPCINNWHTVTVYRGFKKDSTSASSFRFKPTMSTYEILFPGNYDFQLGFKVRYRGKKVPGTIGEVIAPVPGMTAMYTPQLGDPKVGEEHWDLSAIGDPDGISSALSKLAKEIKKGGQ